MHFYPWQPAIDMIDLYGGHGGSKLSTWKVFAIVLISNIQYTSASGVMDDTLDTFLSVSCGKLLFNMFFPWLVLGLQLV